MSRAATKRANAVNNEITDIIKKSVSCTSALKVQVDLARQFVPWVHDNILTYKGDVDSGDRAELAATFDEVFAEVSTMYNQMIEMHGIYNDDPAIYQSNLDTYYTNSPDVTLQMAEDRLK